MRSHVTAARAAGAGPVLDTLRVIVKTSSAMARHAAADRACAMWGDWVTIEGSIASSSTAPGRAGIISPRYWKRSATEMLYQWTKKTQSSASKPSVKMRGR